VTRVYTVLHCIDRKKVGPLAAMDGAGLSL